MQRYIVPQPKTDVCLFTLISASSALGGVHIGITESFTIVRVDRNAGRSGGDSDVELGDAFALVRACIRPRSSAASIDRAQSRGAVGRGTASPAANRIQTFKAKFD